MAKKELAEIAPCQSNKNMLSMKHFVILSHNFCLIAPAFNLTLVNFAVINASQPTGKPVLFGFSKPKYD